MTTKDQDCRTWFEQGKQLPTVEKQYNYFSEGFRKGERYQPWAWAGVGLVWCQKGNLESAIDAFEKALALNPNLPGITDELHQAREKTGVTPILGGNTSPAGQASPDQPSNPSLTSDGNTGKSKNSGNENGKNRFSQLPKPDSQERQPTPPPFEDYSTRISSTSEILSSNETFKWKLFQLNLTQLKELGENCLDQGEIVYAMAAWERAVDLSGGEPATTLDLAMLYSIVGLQDKLKEECEKVVNQGLTPDMIEHLIYFYALDLGEKDRTREVAKKLAILDPTNTLAIQVNWGEIPIKKRHHTLCSEGRRLFFTGFRTQAEYKIREALSLDPNYEEGWAVLAEMNERLGREEDLREIYENILRLNRRNLFALGGLASCLAFEGDVQGAKKLYKEYMVLHPRPWVAIDHLAHLLMDQGNYGEAEMMYRDAVKIVPEEPRAWFMLGSVLMEQGKYREAAPFLRKAFFLEPDFQMYRWGVEINKAIMSGKSPPLGPKPKVKATGRIVQFITAGDKKPIIYRTYEPGPYCETNVKLIPSVNHYILPDTGNKEIKDTIQGGIADALKGKQEGIEKIFHALYEQHPNDKIFVHNLVVCLMQLGKLEEAHLILAAFVEKSRNDGTFSVIPLILLGHVLWEQRNYASAEPCYLEAILRFHSIDRYGAINLNVDQTWKKISRPSPETASARPEPLDVRLPPSTTSGTSEEKLTITQADDVTKRLKRDADEYYAASKINQARDSYLEYLKHVPNDADVWCRLGDMSLYTGKKQRAEREFQECLKNDPKNVHAQDRLNQLKRSRETKK